MAAKQFTDAEGRTWSVVTDLSAARRLRRAGHDIIDFESAGEKIPSLYIDEIDMAEALYAICEPQAVSASPPVSEDDFLSAISGEATEAAREALMAALPDFFSGQKRRVVVKLIEGIERQLTQQVEAIVKSIGSPGEKSTSGSDASDSTASD